MVDQSAANMAAYRDVCLNDPGSHGTHVWRDCEIYFNCAINTLVYKQAGCAYYSRLLGNEPTGVALEDAGIAPLTDETLYGTNG